MADPVGINLGLMGLSAAQAMQQSAAQKSAGEFNAAQYETNAKLASMQAQDAIQRGDIEANRKMMETRRMIGAQRAGYAAQGVDVAGGSAADVQADTAAIGALDAQTIRTNALKEAWGYRMQGLDYEGKARFTKLATENESRLSLLTGGLGVAKEFATAYRLTGKNPITGKGSGIGEQDSGATQ